MCVLSSHLFWTSDLWLHQPGSHRRKVAQDFSNFLLRACFNFLSREGFSRPFPSSTVKSNFVYPRNNRSPLLLVGHDVTKIPSSCDCAEVRTHVPTSEGLEVTRRKVHEKSCVTFLLCDPGWCVHKSDVQNNGMTSNTHTHSKNCTSRKSVSPLSRLIRGFRNKYH